MTSNTKLPIASVSELVSQVKSLVNETFEFVAVRGAITNFSGSSAGHYYFSLSDNDSLINAAMFRTSAMRYPIMRKLKDGDEIECVAELTVYEKRGTIQLIVKQIRLAGEAGLKLEFERIKKKLESLGLFALDRKKRIPEYPRKIGLISAPNSAAIQDFLNIVKRRGTLVDVLVIPAIVQGDKAAESVNNALKKVLKYNEKNLSAKIDVVAICRGGGSIEDLWAFNDEKLCLYVSDFPVPVVSGVGHQPDFSILDFVSDLRAETPSAAAEVLTQKSFDIKTRLEGLCDRLKKSINYIFQSHVLFLEKRTPYQLKKILLDKVYHYKNKLNKMRVIMSPEKYLRLYEYLMALDQVKLRLKNWGDKKVMQERDKVTRLESLLGALDPTSVLYRGYAIVKNKSDNVITSVKDVSDEKIKICFRDGDIDVKKTNA